MRLPVFLAIAFPLLAYAGIKNSELVFVPEATRVNNSQSMDLLSASLNIDPTGTGGVEIAIADGVALESSGPTTGSFVELGTSGTGEISVYKVRPGDTISEIAEMHGVSSNTIIWANDLRGSKIKIGQELVILPISGVRHVVKSGDTLNSISKKYKADLGDILSYNGLAKDSKIKSGDIVIIPDGVVSTTGSKVARSSSPSSSKGYPEYSGYYMRPIVGGRRSQGLHGNNGIDLAAPVGTPILASANGKVIVSRKSGYNGGYGLYVVVSHSNGTQTLYAHMSRNDVYVGQSVSQGQTIGAVGSTGRSTGPHIHFEVRGAKNPF